MNNNESAAFERIKYIAEKVYRNHQNALYMLVNDLEEFFEINDNDVNKMTSNEFDRYIKELMEQNGWKYE